MKHELPIAIGLLAVGCLPWFWQNRESSEASAAIQPPIAAPATPQQGEEPSSVQFSPVTDAQGKNPSANFLRQVGNSFRQGQPSFGYFKFENHLFGSNASGRGGFWCGGLGTGKSRLELILESETESMLTQICDGRFLYRVSEHNGNRRLKFYNINKLNNEDAGIVQSTLPATWIGQSSIGGFFSNIADAFNFEDLKSSTDGQHVEIVGSWNTEYLARLMVNWVDHRKILPKPDWSTVPEQIPHGARLRFTRIGGVWQPGEIVFFRFDTDKTNQPIPALTVKFDPIHQQSIADELFQIDGNETDAFDETDLYNDRIDILTGKHRVAEDSSDAIR